MKKKWIIALAVLCLLFSGCTKNKETTPPQNESPAEAAVPAENQTPVENQMPPEEQAPADNSETEDDPAPTENLMPVEDPSGVENGVYHSEFMGISFTLPEGWQPLERTEIAARMGGNEAYAKAKAADVLPYHIPYVELLAADDNGSFVQLMIENPPVSFSDGTSAETPAAYMDHNAVALPDMYRNLGIEVSSEERGTIGLPGGDFESFSFTASGAITMKQTMMATEKDDYIYTIYITCTGEDRTQELLDLFSSDIS